MKEHMDGGIIQYTPGEMDSKIPTISRTKYFKDVDDRDSKFDMSKKC